MFGDFLGSCERHCFLSRTGQLLKKTWATFLFQHLVASMQAKADLVNVN